ncbi:MAG: UDP-N-acetylglucosamine 2-epimerase [Sphingomonas bacterium]|nr:UDP-N-acetylglucosamine 2-epimerase [Sphingomonas bacterium]
MIRLLSIAGTRPEAIKLAPLALAAERRPGIDHRLIASGQHDRLFEQVVAAFGLRVDRRLGLGTPGQAMATLQERIAEAVTALLREIRPDMLLVQGDTTTAWAAALAASAVGVPIGHVEAGLRSHDMALPWPEERNRVEIDRIATLLFAPSAAAAANLAAEPAVSGQIHVTGNSGIDALLWMRARLPSRPMTAERLVLATCHRRENIGAPIARIAAALVQIAGRGDVRIVLPLHDNPAVRQALAAALGNVPGIDLVEPLGYPEMVGLLARADLILSDSGGLQEEAPALGVPLLVLRDNTERPEAERSGNITIVGTQTGAIVAAANRLLDDPAAHAAMAHPALPYGDGSAAERMLDTIEAWAAAR